MSQFIAVYTLNVLFIKYQLYLSKDAKIIIKTEATSVKKKKHILLEYKSQSNF